LFYMIFFLKNVKLWEINNKKHTSFSIYEYSNST
jgi:hypothetical protein